MTLKLRNLNLQLSTSKTLFVVFAFVDNEESIAAAKATEILN